MQKRRERINAWRKERKQEAEDVPLQIVSPSAKKWTLEDDDDDDDEDNANAGGNVDEDELDPLDAYMQVILLAP